MDGKPQILRRGAQMADGEDCSKFEFGKVNKKAVACTNVLRDKDVLTAGVYEGRSRTTPSTAGEFRRVEEQKSSDRARMPR